MKIRDLQKVMNMENGKATPQLLAFWLLLQCMTWHPSLSLPAWQKSSVHTQHVCTCSRAHTYHISVSKWKPKKTSNRTHRIIVFYILRGQKKKKGKKTHFHHFSPAGILRLPLPTRCLYSVTQLWCSFEWFGENLHNTLTTKNILRDKKEMSKDKSSAKF